jgi:predicted glycogen debranching enzyme
VLRTFAEHVSQGMLPNRFPDAGETPEYNTVDATLWYFDAVAACAATGAQDELVKELYPVLAGIIDWHLRGTRYGICADPTDGLLSAGEPGVQLTWMDAKVGDWVVTPRIGKAVEVNALWINALALMAGFARGVGEAKSAARYAQLAQQANDSFRSRFWHARGGYLYDVIDGPEGEVDALGRRADASLRPNQIIAVALPTVRLDDAQARAVVDVCARELYTSRGLRSLAPDDPRYVGRYGGDPRSRDGAYHQGTVWSWLLGPFARAHYRVHRDAAQALSYLDGMADQLREGCLGSISEIFDADPPHAPRGCFAQAWGVAEPLRAWAEISAHAAARSVNQRNPVS